MDESSEGSFWRFAKSFDSEVEADDFIIRHAQQGSKEMRGATIFEIRVYRGDSESYEKGAQNGDEF